MGKYDVLWEDRFEELKDYRKKYGNCLVPQNYQDNKPLGRWVDTQRYQSKKFQKGEYSTMTKERIAKLKSIDFVWEVSNDGTGLSNDELWEMRFNKLKDYRKKYGNCLVPQKHQNNKKLANWVHWQRSEYKMLQKGEHSQMTKERIAKLKSIDFVWKAPSGQFTANDELWEHRFEELKDYRKKYGNCNVPKIYQDNKQLGTWVYTQRKHFKKFQNGEHSHITKERRSKLDSIGFVWNIGNGRYQKKRKAENDINGVTNNHSTTAAAAAVKFQRRSKNCVDDEFDHQNKRQRRQSDVVVYPDVEPTSSSSLLAPSPTTEEAAAIVNEKSNTDSSSKTEGVQQQQRHHFRDECLAIGLIRADREVWGIIHS